MKKKFDFSAEMAEAEAIKSNPKNESLEEENRLLDINAQELAKLNDNVFKLRTEVENLSDSIRECKPIIFRNAEVSSRIWGKTSLRFSQSDREQMQRSRAKNEKIRQCHPNYGYHILYHCYNTGSPIFFFRQHDSGKHRNIPFKPDL